MKHIIIDRIIKLQEDVEPRSRAAFEVSIGKQSGYLNTMSKRGSVPSADLIKKIIELHPIYSLEWILGLSDEKFIKTAGDAVNEEGTIYDIPKNDFLGLSKRIDLVIKQNTEILDKLNRGIVKDIINDEKQMLKSKSKN